MKIYSITFVFLYASFTFSSLFVSRAYSENKWVNALSKYIFEISTCHCEGNNGCTRGCRRPDQIAEEDMPQVRRCYGKKISSKPTDYCTRYVKSAIMNVIEDFLSPYCEKHSPNNTYQQCVDSFNLNIKDSRINICQHSFVFHSALCMLNLDGKDNSVYGNISNRSVRGNCKTWDKYNQMLYTFSFPVLDVQGVPLFKKIETEKYAEFQQDPSQIPTGAIIISQSASRHGHVEIKTNQLSCGNNKNTVCFCSDFCLERKKYAWPLKILAVYKWNPLFLEYIELTGFL